MRTVKTSFAIIMAAVFVSGCSQSVKDDLATGIDYETDSENIRTLEFREIRNARFCELFFIKVKGDSTARIVRATQGYCVDNIYRAGLISIGGHT